MTGRSGWRERIGDRVLHRAALVSFSLLSLFPATARGVAVADALAQGWRWRELPLPSSGLRLVAVAVDPEQRIVVRTTTGFHRYDGSSWTAVSAIPTDPQELHRAFVASRKGFLVAGRGECLLLTEDGRRTRVGFPGDGSLQSLWPVEGSRALVVGGDSVAEIEEGEVVRTWPLPRAHETILAAALDPRGRLVVSTIEAVLVHDDGAWRPLSLGQTLLPGDWYSRLVLDGDRLWLFPRHHGVSDKVLSWNTSEVTERHETPFHADAMALPGQGLIVTSFGGGLLALEGDEWLEFRLFPLSGEHAAHVVAVGADRLLIQTRSDRLLLCDLGDPSWELHEIEPGFTSVHVIVPRKAGGLWIGTDYGVFAWLDGHVVERHHEAAGVQLRVVTALCEDDAGRLWVGSGSAFSGVLILENGVWRHELEGPGEYAIHAIERAPSGEIWLLSLGKKTGVVGPHGGIVRSDGRTWTRITAADGLSHSRCYDVCFDEDGTILVATLGGVDTFDGRGWSPLPGMPEKDARVLHRDRKGVLWVGRGVEVAGILRHRDGSLIPSGVPELERLATGAFCDAEGGGVWIASPQGLYLFRDDELHEVTELPGVPARSFWPLLAAGDGSLWLGSLGKGLVRFRPVDGDAPVPADRSPSVARSERGVHIFAQWLDPWESTPRSLLRIRHRADGGPWSRLQRTEEIVVNGLATGHHRIEIESADLEGNISLPRGIDVEVPPPFFLRGAFLLPLFALLLLLVFVSASGLRQWRLRREAGRLAEAEREEMQERLRQSQKLEAVGRLAAGVAHDFNNMLTTILGSIELLREDMAAGNITGADDFLRQIEISARRAAGLTQQLLAFGRKQVLAPVVIDLGQVLQGMKGILQKIIRENVELRIEADSRRYFIRFDPNQLEQVLLNLVINARDAMPEGGLLTLEVAELDTVGSAESSGFVILRVRDTGLGMDESTRQRIFEPFFTTKGSGEGTGLGLATVHGIVTQSGGTIRVESEPDQGTLFEVVLPGVEGPAVARSDDSRAPDYRGSEIVLVCEDDELVRGLAALTLQRQGYRVLVAADSAEAEAIARGADEIHLLLTDVILPGRNGRQLSLELQRTRPDLCVLYVSGYATSILQRDCALDPGVAFLQKPFRAEALLRKVREVLDRPMGSSSMGEA